MITKHRRVEQLLNCFIQFITLYLLFLSTAKAEELELTLAEAKVYYTIAIMEQTLWPNEDEFEEFRVAIVGSDSEVFDAFNNKKDLIIREKKFHFEHIKHNEFSVEDYSLIFLTERKLRLNQTLFHLAKNTLIITDGSVDKESQMFSLISSLNNVKTTLNQANLTARGFQVSIGLLTIAGTKKDLGMELKKSESQLKSLLLEVSRKETELNKLNQQLEQKTRLLASAESRIIKNKQLLEQNEKNLVLLTKQINQSHSEKNKIKRDIALQREQILRKQNEIVTQEKSMLLLQTSIAENRNVLAQQIAKIEKQNASIREKNSTIALQKNWLLLILLVSLVFFVMIYFLLKTNRLRRKANVELEQLNAQLHKLATTDDMTKIFNRRHFLDMAQQELNRQQRNQNRSAILMIDIDHFKKINDTHGHVVGDEVIIGVAKILSANKRKYDIVGRFGGEEYAMMLVDCDLKLASEIAQRICDEVAKQEIVYQDIKLKVTVSIGFNQLSREDSKIEQTIVRADKALYRAKAQGRNSVVDFHA